MNLSLNLMKKTLVYASMFVFVFSVVLFPVASFASHVQGDLTEGHNGAEGDLSDTDNNAGNDTITKLKNPIEVDNLNDFIKTILEGAIKIGIPIVAIAIIYSGFLYVTAMGNEEKLKTAHKAITYTLIGAALLLGSWAIAQLISDTVLAL
ncbi:MAG: pilin [bacterium]|nr:pilin [bacterium]